MLGLNPISWRNLLRRLKKLGFAGPYTSGRHEFMLSGDVQLILSNPHRQDIGVSLLTRLLNQARISREEWETEE